MKMHVELKGNDVRDGQVVVDSPAMLQLSVDEANHKLVFIEIDDSGPIAVDTDELVQALRRLVPSTAPNLANIFEQAFGTGTHHR